MTSNSTSLSGIFSTFSTYFSALTSSSTDNQTSVIANAEQALAGIYDTVNDSRYQSIITDQARTKKILDSQTAYLNSVSSSVANATETERRAIQQNNSHKRRYERYNAIMITLTFSLIVCGAFLALKARVPIPIVSQGCTAAIILVLTYDIIYITTSFLDIQKRDRMDFDKIDSDAAGLPSRGTLADMQNIALANSSASTVCSGEACCSIGTTTWDATTSTCI